MGDLKGAILQQRLGAGVETPEQLFSFLPDLRPSSTVFFKPVTKSWKTGKTLQGHYTITNMDHLLSLPRWKWETIYQVPDILEHGVQGAIQQSLDAGGDLRGTEPLHIPGCAPGFPAVLTLEHPSRGGLICPSSRTASE